MQTTRVFAVAVVLSVAGSISGCAADAELDGTMNAAPRGGADWEETQCYGANDCPPGYLCEYGVCRPDQRGADQEGGASPTPPEVEQEREPPASGKVYVYVAVPDQDMVAKIHSETLEVRAIKVGKDPGALRTINGQDVAVVLERLAGTASILRSQPDGGDQVVTLETADSLNQLAVAPGGKHAVAFFDVNLAGGAISPQQTFQEVTVLALEPGKERSVTLSVGFRPWSVQFTSDGTKAFVITEQGISIIELAKATAPGIIPTVPVLKDPLAEPAPDEVLVTPDGANALVRLSGVQGLRVVDLAAKSLIDIDLGDVPTDLDLTDDGGLAIAVLRETHQVALIDVPADLNDPTGIQMLSTAPYVAGQATLSDDSKQAYLFTNATAQEVILIADLATRGLSVFPLQKGVREVLGAPDGTTAVIVHNKAPGVSTPEDDFEAFVDKSYGYSLLDVAAGFDKLLLTPTDPGQLAFAPDSQSAYLMLGDLQQQVRSVEAINLSSFMVNSVELGSHPVSLGVINSTQKVYVAQSHPLGRVTFIDMQTHGTETVTGFELNSYIIQ